MRTVPPPSGSADAVQRAPSSAPAMQPAATTSSSESQSASSWKCTSSTAMPCTRASASASSASSASACVARRRGQRRIGESAAQRRRTPCPHARRVRRDDAVARRGRPIGTLRAARGRTAARASRRSSPRECGRGSPAGCTAASSASTGARERGQRVDHRRDEHVAADAADEIEMDRERRRRRQRRRSGDDRDDIGSFGNDRDGGIAGARERCRERGLDRVDRLDAGEAPLLARRGRSCRAARGRRASTSAASRSATRRRRRSASRAASAGTRRDRASTQPLPARRGTRASRSLRSMPRRRSACRPAPGCRAASPCP